MRLSTETHCLPTENRVSRRGFLRLAGAASLGSIAFMRGYGAVGPQKPATISATDVNGLILLQGAGCNVIAMRGEEGALMIDGGLAANADALLKVVKERTGNNRIHTLINTHGHPEQTGANEAVGREGGVIIAHEKTRLFLGSPVTSALFEGRRAPLPKTAQPNKTTQLGDSLKFAGKQINYGYLPAAHSDGDLYVHFPELNVLVAGGPVSGEQWPLVDYRNGAWFGGRVRALDKLAELVRPDTRVVPAHGRLITGKDIVRLRDIYQELFKTMIVYMNQGMGPEDAARRNALKQYEPEFGDASAFLYGAYRSMQIAYVPD